MSRVKAFIGPNYIFLRTRVHKWLEKNPNVRILDTIELHAQPHKNRKPEKIIVVQYEKV